MKRIHVLAFSLVVMGALAGCGKRPGADAASADQPAATPAEAQAPAASTPVSPYEGKVVRRAPVDGSKEDGWFYVKDGKRHWIVDASWLATQGLKPEEVIEISADALQAIPEDPEALGAPKQ
ncbi:hypothetical protein FHT09_000290 [Xanthomonas arboricola]|uniref:hypothetical protein n=1 Tax=Xanthomonas TaxID=338 RepID=UPI000D4134C9|nr:MULTISPECIES: hypothetical protein [Xanthomonas]MBB5734591.1 hypothetical protein [Xanthomonas sp. CFBP 8152]PPT79886.1 hypothetical protein XarbCFBP8152_07410 [Xanthomonas arboricola]